MTRREQISFANEIAVLCGIAANYFSAYAPPSADQTQAVLELEEMSTRFIELTDPIVDDVESPKQLGICPACGEQVADPEGR